MKLFRTCVLLCLLPLAVTAHEHAGAAATRTAAPEDIPIPLDAATLARQPHQPVIASAHEQPLRCEGVPLLGLLRAAKAMPAEPLRGRDLSRFLRVDARDGYRVLFSLAELDPSLGNRQVFVVDRCDGKPLGNKDGPLRLIAPEDSRPARWVRQLQSITVTGTP